MKCVNARDYGSEVAGRFATRVACEEPASACKCRGCREFQFGNEVLRGAGRGSIDVSVSVSVVADPPGGGPVLCSEVLKVSVPLTRWIQGKPRCSPL